MERSEKIYQIGEVARKSGFSIDAIRYYEKSGLLEKTVRTEGGFRKYSYRTVEQLEFIKKAQSLGLTLSEIKEIIHESRKGVDQCCGFVSHLLNGKLEELEYRIRELQRMKKELRKLLGCWVPVGEVKRLPYTVCPQIEGRIPLKSRRK